MGNDQIYKSVSGILITRVNRMSFFILPFHDIFHINRHYVLQVVHLLQIGPKNQSDFDFLQVDLGP